MNVLLIVEGIKTEYNFFERLSYVYGLNMNIFCIRTNIYSLYKRLKETDFNSNIKDVLKEMNIPMADKSVLDNNFAMTYLIFDCDAHHTEEYEKDYPKQHIISKNMNRLLEMAQYFDNETDPTIGKLYVNYPMMESYRDADVFFDNSYEYNVINIDDIARYKSIVGNRKLCKYHIDKYEKNNFESISKMNLFKLSTLNKLQWCKPTYKDYITMSNAKIICNLQQRLLDDLQQMSVLNCASFLIIDHFGNKNGFYDNL